MKREKDNCVFLQWKSVILWCCWEAVIVECKFTSGTGHLRSHILIVAFRPDLYELPGGGLPKIISPIQHENCDHKSETSAPSVHSFGFFMHLAQYPRKTLIKNYQRDASHRSLPVTRGRHDTYVGQNKRDKVYFDLREMKCWNSDWTSSWQKR